jgi:hypothetical protein
MVFRIVGYTEGFRSYRIGLLAVLALCQKMNSWQVGTTVQVRTGRPVLNANPTKVQIWNLDLNLDFLVGFPNLDFSGIWTPPQKWQILDFWHFLRSVEKCKVRKYSYSTRFPLKSPNSKFGLLVGFGPLHKSRKYWAYRNINAHPRP